VRAKEGRKPCRIAVADGEMARSDSRNGNNGTRFLRLLSDDTNPTGIM